MFEIRDYVQDVLAGVVADERTKARLSEDLTAHIEAAAETEGVGSVLRRMGSPQEMARQLMDGMYGSKEELIAELVQARTRLDGYDIYEYKSKTRILGLPLVHVKMNRNGRGGMCVAKGIIAIGNVAIGAVALGGFSLGGLCLGGISAGLISLGGLALGLLGALGGVAIGGIAMGGCAIGLYAFGGAALAQRVAAGGFASGTIAVGGEAKGLHAFVEGTVSADVLRGLIMDLYPDTPGWLVRLLTLFA